MTRVSQKTRPNRLPIATKCIENDANLAGIEQKIGPEMYVPARPPTQDCKLLDLNNYRDTSGPVNSGWQTAGVSVGTHFFG